jgi:phenylalanyl-tRNA synthetase alpha chain
MALAVGWAIKKGWLKVTQAGDKRILKVAQEASEGPDELLLKQLSLGSLALDDLPQEVAQALRLLKQRPNVLIVKDKVFRSVELTRNGQALAEESLHLKEEVSQVTPELLISGRWKDVEFRKYDIHVPVEPVWPGKKHPFRQFLDEVKLKLVALGFKEMVGPTVESMFFNCDALYMPQDHPAREIHDIYFVKHPSTGSLSKYSQYVSRVKATHEHGWETGSTGWLYRFSMVESSRLILRSQGTAVSTRKLIDADIEIPGKYFSITRVYRPDVVDRTHLTEFHHLEGIVLGEGLTFRSLLGVLETFAKEVAGADKVRFRPDYFPFTEPSVELAAYREGAGWIELGGAGIFRPEVTGPLGINVPVIAWGLGINRMFMMRRGIRDIRYIFSQDLTWLRNQRVE